MKTHLVTHNDHALPPPSRELVFRLSALQRKILSAIQFNGRLSIPEISRIINSKESNVRYALSQLRENDIIYSSPLIDLSRIGYTLYSLVCVVGPKDSRSMDKMREFLAECPQVVSSCETGGARQFSVLYASRSPRGVDAFFAGLEESLGEIIQEKQVAMYIQSADYRSDYLYPGVQGEREIVFGASESVVQLDEVDHFILLGLTEPGFVSLADISRKRGIPLSTIEYRLKRLESEKVILGYRNLIRTDRLGAHRFWMTINVRGGTESFAKKYFKYCQGNPFVRSASHTVGAWDFEMSFDAPNGAAAALILQNFNDEFDGRITGINLVPVFRFNRVNSYPITQFTTPKLSLV